MRESGRSMRVFGQTLGLYNNNKLHAAAACNDLHLGSDSGSGSGCDGLAALFSSAAASAMASVAVAVAIAVAGCCRP